MNNFRFITFLILVGLANAVMGQSSLKGYWQRSDASGATLSMICADNYLLAGTYTQGKFIQAIGGTYQIVPYKDKQALVFEQGFNTEDSTKAGQEIANYFTVSPKGELIIEKGPLAGHWNLVEKMGTTANEGTWLLKAQEDANGRFKPWLKGSLQKVKLMTTSHFIWASYNDETKQILGVCGGTYAFKSGKIFEKVDFSYRTPSPAGTNISLKETRKDKTKTLEGVSSVGKRIHEVWEKQ